MRVLSLDGVSMAIIGCQTPGKLAENARIAREFTPLDGEAMRRLERENRSSAAVYTS